MSTRNSVANAAVILARSGGLSLAGLVASITALGNVDRSIPIHGVVPPERKRRAKRVVEPNLVIPDEVIIENALENDSPIIDIALSEELADIAHVIKEDQTKSDMLQTFEEGGIVCLIDQKVVKDLGRHARKHFGMNAVEYRKKFNLSETYPMTLEGVAKFKESP
jgi:hypothetical protein